MSVKSGQVRAHGETVAEEVTKEESKALLEAPAITLPEESRNTHRTPGFARMRTDWKGDDRRIVQQAKDAVDGRILHKFAGAYEVMGQVYDLVRTPEIDQATGEIRRDQYGFPIWAKTATGSYDEDFTRLTGKQREHLLFLITTRLFEWSMAAADAWAEAMFAKAAWEERFAMGFDAPMTGTVDDRTNAARIDSREERYFAIFMSTYSRKADAVVKQMELLSQRLKDVMTSG